MNLSTAGMCWVGTSPLETMARGKRMTRPNPPMTAGRLASGRHPMTRPVTATIRAHRAAVDRSARDRPTSTAARHMGRVRKRSTVVDDHDPVGELVRLVEVLGG